MLHRGARPILQRTFMANARKLKFDCKFPESAFESKALSRNMFRLENRVPLPALYVFR